MCCCVISSAGKLYAGAVIGSHDAGRWLVFWTSSEGIADCNLVIMEPPLKGYVSVTMVVAD